MLNLVERITVRSSVIANERGIDPPNQIKLVVKTKWDKENVIANTTKQLNEQ
jgi:hypothetical protein